jgi:hypothetical protein
MVGLLIGKLLRECYSPNIGGEFFGAAFGGFFGPFRFGGGGGFVVVVGGGVGVAVGGGRGEVGGAFECGTLGVEGQEAGEETR